MSDPASTLALVLTIVAVNPAGNGNLRAYPKDAPVPNASAINYSAGFWQSNESLGLVELTKRCKQRLANTRS